MTMHSQISPNAPSLEELLWSWKAVIRRAPEGWARNFALSIARQARRKDWAPSAKQLGIMQRMVADLYRERRPEDDDDWNPIEEDEEGTGA